MTTIQTRFEALTPSSDGTTVPYAVIDTMVEERGNGQHRQFLWGRPQLGSIVGEGSGVQVDWKIDLHFFLARNNRTQDAFARTIALEVSDLIKNYSAATSWGSAGVLEVILDNFDVEDVILDHPNLAAGIHKSLIARVNFHFRVLTLET